MDPRHEVRRPNSTTVPSQYYQGDFPACLSSHIVRTCHIPPLYREEMARARMLDVIAREETDVIAANRLKLDAERERRAFYESMRRVFNIDPHLQLSVAGDWILVVHHPESGPDTATWPQVPFYPAPAWGDGCR